VRKNPSLVCLVFAVWCLVFGVWCLVFGVWCLVFAHFFQKVLIANWKMHRMVWRKLTSNRMLDTDLDKALFEKKCAKNLAWCLVFAHFFQKVLIANWKMHRMVWRKLTSNRMLDTDLDKALFEKKCAKNLAWCLVFAHFFSKSAGGWQHGSMGF
jgi:hypothetical protein